jgi:hypothetical protein
MSSTARGGQRNESDFYPTPAWCVHRLLERLKLPGGYWLEPAAGDGAIIRAVNEKRNDIKWHAFEIREECKRYLDPLATTLIADYLALDSGTGTTRMNVSISNYPFSLAMEFIEKSLANGIPYVISLLRLNFLGTAERNGFFHEKMPDVYVIPDRVSFTADGKADSIEYCWMVWGPTQRRREGIIEVLNTTPVDVRRKR